MKSVRISAALALTVFLVAGPLQSCSDPPGGSDADGSAADTDSDASADGSQGTVDFRLPGLSSPVEVRFDSSGVLHLDCRTQYDCYRIQGYFHAQHRFFAMDLIRRQTLGELSSILGEQALSTDKKFRHFMTTRDGEHLEDVFFEDANASTKKMFRAYTAGVNAWLEDMRNGENDAAVTEEYEFPLIDREDIRDWKPTDSVALYLQLSYQLGQKSEDDIFRGRVAGKLPPAMATDILTPKPGVESNILQASGVQPQEALDGPLHEGPAPVERFRNLRDRLRPASRALRRAQERLTSDSTLPFDLGSSGGSNSWAVADSHTATDGALLANDPHLTLNNPSVWYYIEMNVDSGGNDDLHVAGASIPSVPGVVAGFNEDVAWGITTARYDLADAYVEEVTDDGNAVMRDGNRVALKREDFTFDFPDGDSETVTFEWVPGHGPLISKDVPNNRGVSVRWVAQQGGSDLDFIQRLMHADDLQAAAESLDAINTINTSWTLASTDGDIGWYPETKLPKRPWTDKHPNWLPLPGTGGAEWQGFVARENLPEMTNPPNGFIATANNDFDGSYTDGETADESHTPWQSPPAPGYRHKRIVDRLSDGGTDLDRETMADIQADTRSLHGKRLAPEIVNAVQSRTGQLSPVAKRMVEALDDWNYDCPTGLAGDDPDEASPVADSTESRESIGCSVFHVLAPYLTDAVFGDELSRHTDIDAAAHWYKFQVPLLYVFTKPGELQRGTDYFDDVSTTGTTEGRADVVVSALETAAGKIEEAFGSKTRDDWRWGRVHTVTLRSFFAQVGIDSYDYGPVAHDGGFETVDVAPPPGRDGGFDNTYEQRVGASLRMTVEANPAGMEARFELPGGQNLHRDSKWYNSLLGDWLDHRSRKLLFEPKAVRDGAVRTLSIGPSDSG